MVHYKDWKQNNTTGNKKAHRRKQILAH